MAPSTRRGSTTASSRAVEAPGDLTLHGRIQGHDFVGTARYVVDRSAASACWANSSMTLRSPSVRASVNEPVRPEPDAGDICADFFPSVTGALRRIELDTRSSATHPDQAEVAHRGALRRNVRFEMLHRIAGATQLEGVPGSEDPSADDHCALHGGSITSELSIA